MIKVRRIREEVEEAKRKLKEVYRLSVNAGGRRVLVVVLLDVDDIFA